MIPALLRSGLAILALACAAFLILEHGTRGVFILIALALAATVPRTRAWRFVEAQLVRLTGSRLRAAALVMGLIIIGMIAYDVIELVR